MGTRWIALAVLAALAACGSGSGGGTGGTAGVGPEGEAAAVDPEATGGFVVALEAIAGLEPSRRVELLAAGAFETIAADLPCLGELANNPPERRALVLAACEYDPRQPDASPAWFVLQRVGERAARHLAAASGPTRARLEEQMAAARFPLPLAAGGLAQVPEVSAAASAPVLSSSYVVVGPDGRLSVGTWPEGRLGARGAERVTPRGAPFPGDQVERDAVAEAVRAAARPAADESEPAAAERRDREATREVAVLRGSDDSAGVLGVLTPTARLAGMGGAVTPPGERLGDRAEGGGHVAPLLLADRSRPAAEVVELARDLGAALAGVRAPGAAEARALRVELRLVLGSPVGAQPTVLVALGATGGSAASTPGGAGEAAGEPSRFPRADGGYRGPEVADAIAALGAVRGTVILRAGEGVRWGEVVLAAAAVIPLGFERVLLTSPALEEQQAFGGLLGDEIGEDGGFGGTIGLGGGAGTGSGGTLRGRAGTDPRVKQGTVEARGSLDKNIIRRFVRRQLPRVRYCYEKRLLERPTLAGTVRVTFTIDETGAVQGVRAGGLGDREVEDCIAAAVGAIQFPEPTGGSVSVRYPFTLKPGK